MTRDARFWSEVADLFANVVDLDAQGRSALLNAQRADRPEVCAEVESLLTADSDAASFMNPAVLPPADTHGPAPPGTGSIVGAFRLEEPIGIGGMGTVYRGERADEAFRQRVAVKIITTPIASSIAARRFNAERQALASLSHPNIVGLLDAGLTSDGYAYLVMEHIEGAPIGAYCRDRRLPLVDRLLLFRTVCSAVHYAHRHGVVHRDLKPANILVTADGVVKVLDFGIARLLDDAPAAPGPGANDTGLGLGPLTLNYASPEQVRGLPITTSSDVYSLGVLLYELVAGVRPYETAGKPFDEVLQLVAHSPPARPSAAARRAVPQPPYAATALQGDVDAIVVRAIAKEPDERYRSAQEMADDVARHLHGNPVMAREPSPWYVLRKLAGRHRVPFVTATVSIFVVIVALMVAIVQARIATAERRRAERRFGEVRQLANALIFKIHDAVAPLAGSTPVRQAIVAEALTYLEKLAAEAQGDPVFQVELARAYIRIGRVQGLPGTANLGDRAGALASFRRAQVLVEPVARDAASDVSIVGTYVEATRRVSETLNAMGNRGPEAAAEARKAVIVAEAYYRRLPGDVPARNLLASASFTAAMAVGGKEALLHWTRAGELYDSLLADNPDEPQTQRNVALVQKYLGAHFESAEDFARALAHHERARAADERRLAQDPANRVTQLDVAIDLSNVAFAHWRQGSLAPATELYERSLGMRQALMISDPTDAFARSRVAFVRTKLAEVLADAKQWNRAAEHARAAVQIHESAPLPDAGARFEAAWSQFVLGKVEAGQGRRSRSCALFGTAHRAMAAIDARTRQARSQPGRDPLADLAAAAAGCRPPAER